MGRLERVLERLKRQKSERGPWGGAQLWPGENTISLKKRTYRPQQDPLTTDADTQLGRFGPGADSKRSKASYPLPRCVLDHNLNGNICSCKYTTLIVFAQN